MSYRITIRGDRSAVTSEQPNKRLAIRHCRKIIRASPVGTKGDVTHDTLGLIYQCEAHQAPTGVTKVRALEL